MKRKRLTGLIVTATILGQASVAFDDGDEESNSRWVLEKDNDVRCALFPRTALERLTEAVQNGCENIQVHWIDIGEPLTGPEIQSIRDQIELEDELAQAAEEQDRFAELIADKDLTPEQVQLIKKHG